MLNGNVLWTLALGAVSLAGCSLVLDSEKKQCTEDAECGTFGDAPIYACVKSFCEAVACEQDAECRARGDFICEENACAPSLCRSKDECTTEGDECVEGRCINPIFHCFYEQPPLMSEDEPVLKFSVVAYSDSKALSAIDVKVCSIADTVCATPIPAEYEYNEAGELTIRGLENGRRYSIRMTGADSEGSPLMESEYYMQRPVVGLTQEADRFEMVNELLVTALAATVEIEWDPGKGLVIAEIFGCDNLPLAGVSFTDDRLANLFYLTGSISATATATDALGVGGFANMEVSTSGSALLHKLTFSYGAQTLYSFAVPPRPRVVTFLNLYMADYGSTTGRAPNLNAL